MKVLIDMTHIYVGSLYASTSIYIFRILDSIDQAKRKTIKLLILPELEEYIQNKYSDYQYILFPYATENVLQYKKGINRIIFQSKQYRKVINDSQCEGLFIASDHYLYTCIPTNAKKIVVIHDLKSLKDDTTLRKIKYYIFYLLLILSSYKTIAISNYTKTDIIRYFSKFISKKICVVYNSIQLSEKTIRPQAVAENLQYILYVNTLQKYKNIKTLLKAISLIQDSTHKLVIVGKPTPYWTEKMLPYIRENHLAKKIIHLDYVTNEELHWLYDHASLFVSCSTREGFGYTPIEAAICKCPVICTTCESLSETTMNKLEYYTPPYNVNELSSKIQNILTSPRNSTILTEISTVFSNRYSPKEQANKIFDLFTTK